MKAVRPGLNIGVVTEMDPFRETISVRSSTIYELHGNRLVIAQTEPRITTSGHHVVITYLTSSKEGQRRGFNAEITEIIEYQLAGGQKAEALVAIKKNEPSHFSIRMFYRVEPPDDGRVRLFVDDVGVTLLDISLRGARFLHNSDLSIETCDAVRISIDIGARTYNFQGRITRTWNHDDLVTRGQNGVASVEFIALSGAAERALLHKLRQFERESMRDRDSRKATVTSDRPEKPE